MTTKNQIGWNDPAAISSDNNTTYTLTTSGGDLVFTDSDGNVTTVTGAISQDICSQTPERSPDEETVLFLFCDKDGPGSINLADLINLIATTDGGGAGDAAEKAAADWLASKEGKFEMAFAEHERQRQVREREARKEEFRKTYEPVAKIKSVST